MKKYFLIVFLFFLSLDSFSQWTSEMTLPFSVQSQTKLNTFVDANGVHIVYWRNGGIKYALVRSNGTVVRYDRVIEAEGSGADFVNIVSVDNNYLYAIYKKNNTINVKRSVNVGSSWSQFSSRPMTNSGCDKMVAYVDGGNIHIGWTEFRSGSQYFRDSYYIRLQISPLGWWDNKKVTDLETNGGYDPDLTISPDKIHYTYLAESWSPKSRDKFKTAGWENPQSIPFQTNQIKYQKPVIANNKLNEVFREEYCLWQGCGSVISFADRPFNQGFWNSNYFLRESDLDKKADVESTVDNKIHLLYFDKIDNQWQHRYILGTTLSNKIAEIPLIAYWSTSLVANSNDLYLAAIISESTPSNPRLQHYDVAPAAPKNLSITKSANNHPLLSWLPNTEPDKNYYKLYRWDSYGGGWQYLAQTSSTSYEDATLTYCTAVPPQQCENLRAFQFKVTAVDLGSHESEPSNIVETRLVGGSPSKAGADNPGSETVFEYSLEQNYPNPFNPTTHIDYSIKSNGLVTLKVYDMLGTEVASLVNENKEAGNYSIEFNASELPSGIYFYTLISGNFMATKKLILLK